MHVAVVMDKSGASMYHNGKRVGITNKKVDLSMGNQEPVYVGIMGYALNRLWFPIDGYIDELRIYNRTLKSEEIQKLYKYDLAESIDMIALKQFGSVDVHHGSEDGVFTSVSLKNSSISDASLRSLLRFDRLKALDLSGTKITDDGLQHLRGLQELKKVNLSKTGVTDEGLKKLRKVFPECLIER
jgi:hypothetical protein